MQALTSIDQSVGVTSERVRNIIVVEDSAAQRKLISTCLRQWGYDVREAASGHEALQLCREQCPDMIVSDWLMPGMDGLELCKAVRRMSGRRYIYLIVLTSKSGSEDITRGLEAGADDFLTKPVDPSELRARIRAAIRLLSSERELTIKNGLLKETLAKVRALYSAVDRDLREAADFQQSLIRDKMRHFKSGCVSLEIKSCGHVGGDMVGMFQAEERYMGLYAIDVSGHGISSALMVARVVGCLSAASPEQNIAYKMLEDGSYVLRNPADTVAQLNHMVLSEMRTDHYFTLLLAILDVETGQLAFSQAGHPHPIVLRKDGTIETIGQGGMPVGLFHDASFEEAHVQLRDGDRLVICSDGLSEQPMREGLTIGETVFEDLVRKNGVVGTSGFLEALFQDVLKASGHRSFEDDVSGIVLNYSPNFAGRRCCPEGMCAQDCPLNPLIIPQI